MPSAFIHRRKVFSIAPWMKIVSALYPVCRISLMITLRLAQARRRRPDARGSGNCARSSSIRLADLDAVSSGWTKYRQSKGRFCDEDIAGFDFREGGAGWIGCGVCSRPTRTMLDDALCSTSDLRRAENMPGRQRRDIHPVDRNCFAILDGLRGARMGLAHPDGHDGQRLGGCQHMGVAWARMVRMPMGDDRSLDAADRVDVEIPRRAIKALRRGVEQGFGFQRAHEEGCSAIARLCTPLRLMEFLAHVRPLTISPICHLSGHGQAERPVRFPDRSPDRSQDRSADPARTVCKLVREAQLGRCVPIRPN
jgi:hypothetical protein